MSPQRPSMKTRQEFDYIIVGAGSAGCVLAARRSQDPKIRVALVEAGGPDDAPEISMPVAFPQLFKTKYDWDFTSEPEPGLGNRRIYLPRGKTLGGSSAMNAMIYIRGNAADFDVWADEGAPRSFHGHPRAAIASEEGPGNWCVNPSGRPGKNSIFHQGNHPCGRSLWLTTNPHAVRCRAGRRTGPVRHSCDRRPSGRSQPSGPSAAGDELFHRREVTLRRWLAGRCGPLPGRPRTLDLKCRRGLRVSVNAW